MTALNPDHQRSLVPSPRAAGVYDGRTILLHWLVAALVAGQWLGAHAIDWFPRGDPRTIARSLHIVGGTLLAATIVARLAWRFTGGRKLAPADRGALRLLAAGVQALLYVLVIATVTLGLLNALARGDSLFGLLSLPKLALDPAGRRQIGDLHGLVANAILVVAAVHSGAALVHQFVWRDGLLGRMIPALAVRS